MPKFVILGSCKYAPYITLLCPNPFNEELYIKEHEKAYVEACKHFYPAIKESDFVIVYAPTEIGKHTQQDINFARKHNKPVIIIDAKLLEKK